MPARLNGARLARLLRRHRGSRTVRVSPTNAFSRLTFIPNVEKSALKVSPRTMLYARMAKKVFMMTVVPGIHAVDCPMVFSQAVR